jgi:hypothetical protein
MALTVESSPQDYTTSDNPVTWVWSSDETAQDNFSYRITVIIGGVTNSVHLVFPEAGEYAHFDMSQIVKSELTHPPVDQTTIEVDGNNYIEARLLIEEVYGTPATGQDSLQDASFIYKARLDDLDWIDLTATDFYWMTEFPSTEQYLVGYNEEQRILIKNNTVTDTITIELFDISGSSINSVTEVLSSNRMSQLNIKPSFLVANTSLTQANFDSAYRMVLTTDSGGKGSREFHLDNTCDKYERKRFMFLSRIGSLESFSFTQVSRLTSSGKGANYSKQFGEWVGTEFQYNKSSGRNINYVNTFTDKLSLNSDFISEGKQNWVVKNLLESPLVYLQDGDDLIRVVVTGKGYEQKKRENDLLFNQTLEVDFSNTRKSALI